MTRFQIKDPSRESQWRALVLFGKNTAAYKFAFAQSLLQLVEASTSSITLAELARPFADNLVRHLRQSDKQGSFKNSRFLNYCHAYIEGEITREALYDHTERMGFRYVVEAFQNVNGGQIPDLFYERDYGGVSKQLIIKDNLLLLKESAQFQNLIPEVEARWNLVETAWNLSLNPNLLEVAYDGEASELFFESNAMRRKTITSARDALNGYQKGKCFYSSQDIVVTAGSRKMCHVDHFLPHVNKRSHAKAGVNIDGLWNLVLTDPGVNLPKGSRIPTRKFLYRLHERNEFYITSKHPLGETIVNQTGRTKATRQRFLEQQYNLALSQSILTWEP